MLPEKAEQADALEEALHVVDEDLEADVKFMWETYRTVLEILQHNSKLEALYAVTAHKALQFCKKYKRPTEFHRLCEMIRNHNKNTETKVTVLTYQPLRVFNFVLIQDLISLKLLLSLDSGRKLFVLLKIYMD